MSTAQGVFNFGSGTDQVLEEEKIGTDRDWRKKTDSFPGSALQWCTA